MRLIFLGTITHLFRAEQALPFCHYYIVQYENQPFYGVLKPYVVRREQLSFSFHFLCIEVYLTDGVSLRGGPSS